jgi:intraflagellar transport protein 140
LLYLPEHCLGNMEHVRGARALRESAGIPELDARVGLVAVQLGLADDAARLFSSCERWDLLEQLHMAAGHWEAALDVAAKQDRSAAGYRMCWGLAM